MANLGEYMRASNDDPNIRVIVLAGVGREFRVAGHMEENFPGNRGAP